MVNTRAHPLDLAFTRISGFIPMFALGLVQPTQNPADSVSLAVMLTGTVWQFFIHANVRWRFGWLEYLVSTPAFHHWHHTRHDHVNHNYSTVLPWMDRVFGTYYLPRDRWPDDYGIDETLPDDLAGQLLHPLHGPQAPPVGSEVR
jgi:sterol desaturase/sphingolipid hydroxylase (fatty acid hydroxylase superfamily)